MAETINGLIQNQGDWVDPEIVMLPRLLREADLFHTGWKNEKR